jgi:hypothetical protein
MELHQQGARVQYRVQLPHRDLQPGGAVARHDVLALISSSSNAQIPTAVLC